MQLRMHAKTGNNRPGDRNEGAGVMLKAYWLVYPCSSISAFFLLFFAFVRLLHLALHLRPSLSTGFSFGFSSLPLLCEPELRARTLLAAGFPTFKLDIQMGIS